MYCNNCGRKGHISRNCNEPITSYGVLLLSDIHTIPKLTMIQRKDSICYYNRTTSLYAFDWFES